MGFFSQKEYELHPDGPAVLTLADSEFKADGQFGPQMQWKFDSSELMEDGRPFRISYWTGTALSSDPRNKFGKLLTALGLDVSKFLNQGSEPAEEDIEELDPASLMGRKVQAMIVHAPDKTGTIRANIDSMTPYRPKKQRPAAAEPAPAPVPAPRQAASVATADDDWQEE